MINNRSITRTYEKKPDNLGEIQKKKKHTQPPKISPT